MNRSIEYLVGLVKELCKFTKETEWVEFKHNYAEPEEIGEYLSALSNSAALNGLANAYIVWGVDDATHEIIGTSFNPSVVKIGNEELEGWLSRLLTPGISFRFLSFEIAHAPVVLLEIGAAFLHPVRFKQQEFIRIGSYKKKLKDYPEKERELWRIFDRVPFERGIAAERISGEEVLTRLDYPTYFDLLDIPLPDSRNAILEALANDELISCCEAGNWNITRLGALLLAKRMDDFPDLRRKAIRVILYKGRSRVETFKEQIGSKGYWKVMVLRPLYGKDGKPIRDKKGNSRRIKTLSTPNRYRSTIPAALTLSSKKKRCFTRRTRGWAKAKRRSAMKSVSPSIFTGLFNCGNFRRLLPTSGRWKRKPRG